MNKFRIFIGSSSEAVDHAKDICKHLKTVEGLEPLLWTESFPSGYIILERIEELTRTVSGAILLASPDDESKIREKNVRVPRTNVMYEYGYFCALLGRHRVALCCYHDTELPSDLEGLTVIDMGSFDPNSAPSEPIKSSISKWAQGLMTPMSGGLSTVSPMHGYSGVWTVKTNFEIWRGISLSKQPEGSVIEFSGRMHLSLPRSGRGGRGVIYGNLDVDLVGICEARFSLIDEVRDAHLDSDGTLVLRSRSVSRHRVALEGDPPQNDGFEPKLVRAIEFDSRLRPTAHARQLLGTYSVSRANEPYSKAEKVHEFIGPEF